MSAVSMPRQHDRLPACPHRATRGWSRRVVTIPTSRDAHTARMQPPGCTDVGRYFFFRFFFGDFFAASRAAAFAACTIGTKPTMITAYGTIPR